MANPNRTIRRKEITELARQTWLRIWSDQMPKDWRVYLVRKTVIQRVHRRSVCGVLLRRDKRILVGRHTKHYSFQTLVHELAHLLTPDEPVDHGPIRDYEFQSGGTAVVGQRASNGYMTRAFSLPDISAKARASGPTCDVMDQRYLLGAFGLSAAGPREAL
jgi:hypothetical protein